MRLSCGSLDRISQFTGRLGNKLGLAALKPALPGLDILWLKSLPTVSSNPPKELNAVVVPRLALQLPSLLPSQVDSFARFLTKGRFITKESHPVLEFLQESPYLLPLPSIENIKKTLEFQSKQALPGLLYRCFQQEFDISSNSKHFQSHFGSLPDSQYRLRVNKPENSLTIRNLPRKLTIKILGITHNNVAGLDDVFEVCGSEEWNQVLVDFPEGDLNWKEITRLNAYFRLNEPAGLIQRQEFGLARIDPMLSIAYQLSNQGRRVLSAAPALPSQFQALSHLLEKDARYDYFCMACHYELAEFLRNVTSRGCNFCSGRKDVPLARSQLVTQLFPEYREWYYWMYSAKVVAGLEQGGKVLACVHAPMQFEVTKRILHLLQGGKGPEFPASTSHLDAAEAMLDECLSAYFRPSIGDRKAAASLRVQQSPWSLQEWKHSKFDKSCFAVAQLKKVS